MQCLPPYHDSVDNILHLLAIQSVVKTLLDADCQHFCDSTGLAPSQASPVLEQQFEVEPHQTTLSVDCCLTLLCLGINTIESQFLMSGVPLGVIFLLKGGHNQCFPPQVRCSVES